MVAQSKKITTIPTKPPSHKMAVILQTKHDHPDLTTREIAAIAETDHSHVIKTLQRYKIPTTHLDQYKTHRADILAGLQHRFITSVTDTEIKKTPVGTRILAACQLYDKERIERGLSDNNTRPLVVIQIKGDHTAISVDNPVDNLMGKDIKQIEG